MIRLIGPGGAGKTTTGRLLADRIGMPFIDLDELFMTTVGSISDVISAEGYSVYAARNVALYIGRMERMDDQSAVFALSSGFMVYPTDIHPRYAACRTDIIDDAQTFVLLPSMERNISIEETVRRQLGRPFCRSPQRERRVIAERFDLYRSLPCEKIETMRPLPDVVASIASLIDSKNSESISGIEPGHRNPIR